MNWVAQEFSRAAAGYNHYAALQREVVDALKAFAEKEMLKGAVLDAGAGTGYALQAGWTALDIAPQMCAYIEQHFPQNPTLCADMSEIPAEDAQFDAVFSSLAMQWLSTPSYFFAESYRVTRKDGALLLATLVEPTLSEFSQAYQTMGEESPMLKFQHAKEVTKQCEAAGWNIEAVSCQPYVKQYASVMALMKMIKGLGARTTFTSSSRAGLRGKSWLQALEAAYPRRVEYEHACVASWQVLMLKAKK